MEEEGPAVPPTRPPAAAVRHRAARRANPPAAPPPLPRAPKWTWGPEVVDWIRGLWEISREHGDLSGDLVWETCCIAANRLPPAAVHAADAQRAAEIRDLRTQLAAATTAADKAQRDLR